MSILPLWAFVKGLNRTFYGIETTVEDAVIKSLHVLIVPFMELKQNRRSNNFTYRACLNRTFYGIETLLV